MSYSPVSLKFENGTAKMTMHMTGPSKLGDGHEWEHSVDVMPLESGAINVAFRTTQSNTPNSEDNWRVDHNWRFHESDAFMPLEMVVELRDQLNAAIAKLTPQDGPLIATR